MVARLFTRFFLLFEYGDAFWRYYFYRDHFWFYDGEGILYPIVGRGVLSYIWLAFGIQVIFVAGADRYFYQVGLF